MSIPADNLNRQLVVASADVGTARAWVDTDDAGVYSHMIHGQDDEAARKWEEFQNQPTGGVSYQKVQ